MKLIIYNSDIVNGELVFKEYKNKDKKSIKTRT